MKKTWILVLLLGLIGVTALIVSLSTPAGVQLVFAPPIGAEYRTSVSSQQNITQTINGQETNAEQTLGFDYLVSVREGDTADSRWIDITYERFWVDQITAQGELHYDSADPDAESSVSGSGYQLVLGKGFSLQASPGGELLALSGIDELLDELVQEMGYTEEAVVAQVREQLEEQFGETALREQMEGMFVSFPAGALEVDNTWQAASTTGGLMPLDIAHTYTVLAVEDETVTLQVDSTIVSDPEAEPTDVDLYFISYDLAGEQSGSIEIDTATGWIRHSHIVQNLAGSAQLTAGEDEVTIPMNIESITQLEMQPVAP